MKSPLTKLTAAAVIIIAVLLSIRIFNFDIGVTPVYALEQTIEATHTIKTIQFRMFEGEQSIENNEFSDYWIKYDKAGKLLNLRCNKHGKDGVKFTVWNDGIKKTWVPENNVVIVNRQNNVSKDIAKKWEDFAKECDPKLFLQWIYDQAKKNEKINIKIDEPAEDSNSIYVKATGRKDRVELVVDRKTKLIKKFSVYQLKKQQYKFIVQVEFLAYNKPIDPSIFELGEVPDDAEIIDKLGDIIPGLRVGDYTIGMSKDDVFKKLGEPRYIHYGGERYTLDNLPRRYYLSFENISFDIYDDSVQGFGVRSSLYKFLNGLGVGDSEQKIEQTFGEDFHLEEGKEKDYLIYEDKGLSFEIHKQDRTVMEINVYRPESDHRDSNAPDSGKEIMISEQSSGPITFPKVDRKPKPSSWNRGEIKSLPKYDPDSDNSFQVDLRCYDLSKLDLSNSIEDLLYASFDDRTVWPGPDRMPSGFDRQKIMELGKNPGLGVRRLHEKGITGRGVRIAILDQPLLVDHQEYAERVRLYEEIDLQGRTEPSMHGAAVVSIAVGKTVGVAPEAELYYIAKYNFDRKGTITMRYIAQGIDRILEINKQLPKDNKIRAISISRGWAPSDDGYDDVMAACEEAKAAGIFVVSCSLDRVYGFSLAGLGRNPLASPDLFESYEPGLFWAKGFYNGRTGFTSDHLLVPMDSRTTASPAGSDEYVFYRQGGMSWSVPYVAGVYALAVQVDSAITPERFWDLAIKTNRAIELEHKGERRSFGPIIDPVRLIRAIQAGETVTLNRKQSDTQPAEAHRQTHSETQTIVPGIRVGDYTLGMRKDDVLKKLGDPKNIFWGGERYTLDNLPRRYFISYGDVSFSINDDVVTGITALSPSYKFANGLGVGDSVDKVKQAFGNDFQLREFEKIDILTYEDKGISFEINKKDWTVLEVNVYRTERNQSDSPKEYGRDDLKMDGRDDLNAYEDVSGKDLRASDLRYSEDILDTLEFNQETQWPPPERLPKGFDPRVLLQEGMNPGLGVRGLHAQGITGASVHVGLIDQPLLLEHPEYVGKIMSYNVIDCGSNKSSMHGPAMTSQLVGKHCGTAPGAILHVVAVPSWKADAGYYARALDRFVTYNENAPKKQKIRVVSVSCQPSGEGSVFENQPLWDEAVQRAQANGILVLDCTWHHGFVSLCWLDPENRESVEACTPGFRNGTVEVDEGHIHVPSAPRTAAQADEDGSFGYAYDGGGRRSRRPKAKNGYSDTIPYAAGILALGWQIRPELTPEQIKALLFKSAHVHESGARIIHPTAFIDLVRSQSSKSVSEGVCKEDSETQTILPGKGVGAYTLDMSKDDVLSKLGEPEAIYLGEQKYNLNDLPRRYIMAFGDVSFWIDNDSVNAISVHNPLYKLDKGLGLGDSEQKIKQAFGDDFQPRKEEGKDFLCYDAKGLGFVIHEKNQTVAEIVVYKPEGNRVDSDTPDSRKVIMLGEQPPGPITFPKIDRRPKRAGGRSGKMKYGPEEMEILKLGKNPGLGVRTLHKRGITGKGVGIAIIDRPLLTEHQEYADRLRLYEENNIKDGAVTAMHGSAVASIAVGKTVGVAPDADLYYIATMNWDVSKGDDPPINFRFKAQSIRRLLEINRQLPADRKIRVISMSTGWGASVEGYDEIMAACKEAKAAGIFVVSVDLERVYDGFSSAGLGRHPLANPDSFESYEPGLFWAKRFYDDATWLDSDRLLVPMDSRTIADFRGTDEYLFYREGGMSWAVPYIAGVYALAAQVEPEITPERFWSLAMQTGRTINLDYNGKKLPFGPIIDPVALINTLQKK